MGRSLTVVLSVQVRPSGSGIELELSGTYETYRPECSDSDTASSHTEKSIVSQRTQLIVTIMVIIVIATVSFMVWQERSHPEKEAPISKMLGIDNTPSMFEADITEWTPLIRQAIAAGEWETLAEDLADLAEDQPEVYKGEYLDYLHARVLIEAGELDEAETLLQRFLEPGNDFRVLALQHAERIAEERDDPGRASELRRELIRDYEDSYWREGAVEREIESLDEPEALIEFSQSFGGDLPDYLRRDLQSRAVEARVELNREQEAIALGFELLDENIADDAAERVWRVLDRPALVGDYSAAQLYLLARTAHNHRHFPRAAEILAEIESKIPGKGDEIRFAIGRAFFFDERFAEAEAAYIRAAGLTKDREEKARLYYHAARSALLQGKDDVAEKWLTSAIAVPGKFEATAVALVQRMRLRLKQDRSSDASHDVQLLRKLFPNGESIVEASIGYAVAAVAAGDGRQALRTLGKIRRASTDGYDRSEIAYWKGRAYELQNEPLEALDSYLDLLRSEVPSHYKWFARERLQQPALEPEIEAAVERRRPRIRSSMASGKWDVARALQSDIVAMRPGDEEELARLGSIYEKLGDYEWVLDLEPAPLPALPLSSRTGASRGAAGAGEKSSSSSAIADRGKILIALGLEEEAVDRIPEIYPLRPASSGVTQAAANRLAGATKPSIYAIEVTMGAVPDEYVFELLPEEVQTLLYPHYFEEIIKEKSDEHGADPRLVRSIMREESRFDPRAKSFAAARGLLQFIISTAKEIGASIGLTEIESSDLYEPETIIDLGAKYVADLLEEFDGNRYRAAAAYNAGPNQAALWSRLASSEGDEYFFAAINFDETRHYVRKVLNSYRRYESLERPAEAQREEMNDGTDRTDTN